MFLLSLIRNMRKAIQHVFLRDFILFENYKSIIQCVLCPFHLKSSTKNKKISTNPTFIPQSPITIPGYTS